MSYLLKKLIEKHFMICYNPPIHPNCCIFSVLLHGGWGSFLFLPITDT